LDRISRHNISDRCGYYCAAIVAGVIVGGLWPLTQWRAGAIIVGTVGGTAVYGAVAVAIGQGTDAMWIAPIAGMMVGGGLSYHWWSEAHPEDQGTAAARWTVLVATVIVLLAIVVVGIAARH
jgi:hypothetical protein